MELTPPKGKLIIKRDEPKSRTDSGIILRPDDRQRSLTGMIMAAYHGSEYMEGQQVVFETKVSNTFNFRDENLVMVSEDSIMAIL